MSNKDETHQLAELSQPTDFKLFDDFEFDSELLDSFFEGTIRLLYGTRTKYRESWEWGHASDDPPQLILLLLCFHRNNKLYYRRESPSRSQVQSEEKLFQQAG